MYKLELHNAFKNYYQIENVVKHFYIKNKPAYNSVRYFYIEFYSNLSEMLLSMLVKVLKSIILYKSNEDLTEKCSVISFLS